MSEPRERASSIPHEFLEPWPERLHAKPSLFYYTSTDGLAEKAKFGFRGFQKQQDEALLSDDAMERIRLDAVLTEVAEELGESFQRSDFVFLALPEELDTANWKRFGKIKLEVKVDGDVARVYDHRLHSYGVIAYYRTPEGKIWLDRQHPQGTRERQQIEEMLTESVTEDWRSYFQAYLRRGVTLDEFMALSAEERKNFVMPEVLVPAPIGPERIRLAKSG